jgi:hypothetical protein
MTNNPAQEGTLKVNTTAVHSVPNCQDPAAPANMIHVVDPVNDHWSNSAVYQGCNFTWSVKKDAKDLFGLTTMGANNTNTSSSAGDGCAQFRSMDPWNQPVIMWFFTYESTPANASIAFCRPAIELWTVTATIDLASRNLTKVDAIAPLQSGDAGAELIGNLTGSPTYGQALNGAAFNVSYATADQFVLGRANATSLQLPAAVMQKARGSSIGLVSTFVADGFVPLSQQIYVSGSSFPTTQGTERTHPANVPSSVCSIRLLR